MDRTPTDAPDPIEPHGGTLVDRVLTGAERERALAAARDLPAVALSERSLQDLVCIATGVYSPLEGFVDEPTYRSIVERARLPSGLAWPIPITLQLPEEEAARAEVGADLALTGPDGILAVLSVTDVYRPDQDAEAEAVYRTRDDAHPGVAAMRAAGPVYVGGPIRVVADLPAGEFPEANRTPAETRAEFRRRGWRSVVAFQTRNPIHRAHEYLTKVALENVDGLLIHPLVGSTKSDDIAADVRMRCYDVLLRNYYPPERVTFGTYPAAMRYAGPREALLHAISRQNYGCTHFIVGRDAAGVGDYYGTYDAQELFDEFGPSEMKIQPLKFEHAFYCRACESMASTKTCPHDPEQRVHLSGTKVRAMLREGKRPPQEFSRREVADILVDAYAERQEA